MSFSNEEWMKRAACKGDRDSEQFYVAEYKYATVAELKTRCGFCPVKTECSDFAERFEGTSYRDTWGIYGGETAKERITRRNTAERPEPCASAGVKRGAERHLKNNQRMCQSCQDWQDRRDADAKRWAYAEKLLRKGHTPYEVAQLAGVHRIKALALRERLQADSL